MEESNNQKQKLTLSLDYKILCAILLVVIVGMLILWKPWDSNPSTTRKLTISGESTIKAEPDQFQFNPYYELNTIDEVTSLNDQVVKKLKELGVDEKDIKNNASQYGSTKAYYMMPVEEEEKVVLNLTITANNKELAQKVQDYLLTTNPKGSITPYPTFSKSKQKALQEKARSEAIAEARKKAEKTAQGLGAKIGKVLELEDKQSSGIFPMYDTMVGSRGAEDSVTTQSLTIQPGENEIVYTVSVVFELR